jgi:hypothetical protein
MRPARRGTGGSLGKEVTVTDHPAEDFTGGELDEPLVDDLIDETRGPEEDPPGELLPGNGEPSD